MPWREVITNEESPEFALFNALDNQAFMFRSVDALVAKTCKPAEWIREVVAAHPTLVRRSNGERETYGLIERVGGLEPQPVVPVRMRDMPMVSDDLSDADDDEGFDPPAPGEDGEL